MKRSPAQGLSNVLRFNWHYYIIIAIIFVIVCLSKYFLPALLSPFINLTLLCFATIILLSLLVTYYVYDVSQLYTLQWLRLKCDRGCAIANIHAGFDETSYLLKEKFPHATLYVFDFYHPDKHTEVSIRRARKAYPPFQGTATIETAYIPLPDETLDRTILFMAAHEIRNTNEREIFFNEINRTLAANGTLILVEHLRDICNFFAYNIGAFHFQSASTWINTFTKAGFKISSKQKITPFVTVYNLSKNGNTN